MSTSGGLILLMTCFKSLWSAGRKWEGLDHRGFSSLGEKFVLYSKFYGNRHIYTHNWRRQWHPTPVLLPGKSHGWRSLVGCSPWGCRVGHDCANSLSLFTFLHWRRKWQPTPVFLPGESQGQRSLVGCCLWGHTESDTIEVT